MKDFEKWFRTMAPKVFKANQEKGFWDEQREDWECMALILTEAAEAVEADRKKKNANDKDVYTLMTIELCDSGFRDSFKNLIKDTVQDELADICIRCLDLAGSKDKKYLNYKKTANLQFLNRYNLLGFYWDLTTKAQYMVENNLIGHLKEICFEIISVYGSKMYDHIDLKLKYNSMRERLHGKEY